MTNQILKDRSKMLASVGGDEGALMFTALIWKLTERNTVSITLGENDFQTDDDLYIPRLEIKAMAAAAGISKKRVRFVLDALVDVISDPEFSGAERLN